MEVPMHDRHYSRESEAVARRIEEAAEDDG
jgi:hypothetical protein